MFDLILLIDDSEADNFFHKIVIEQANFAKQVISMTTAQAALEFLNTPVDGKYPQPDLIFLDINMPGMNGWEFMDEYAKLNSEQKGGNLVVMLSTSLNPDDDQRARENPLIQEFINKPLSVEILQGLIAAYAV